MKNIFEGTILPGVGVGEFLLKDHISNHFDLLMEFTLNKVNPLTEDLSKYCYLGSPLELIYSLGNIIELSFHTMNGKLFKVRLKSGYKGAFNRNVFVGMTLNELLKFEPSFEYNSDDECFKSATYQGISITNDVNFQIVEFIDVFISEYDSERFEDALIFKRGSW